MSDFVKVECPRTFGSVFYEYEDVDGKRRWVPHVELINGEYVETKEYKEMMKWRETP